METARIGKESQIGRAGINAYGSLVIELPSEPERIPFIDSSGAV
jgi:hypothetical protein